MSESQVTYRQGPYKDESEKGSDKYAGTADEYHWEFQ